VVNDGLDVVARAIIISRACFGTFLSCELLFCSMVHLEIYKKTKKSNKNKLSHLRFYFLFDRKSISILLLLLFRAAAAAAAAAGAAIGLYTVANPPKEVIPKRHTINLCNIKIIMGVFPRL
jgi:hypothetical protein